MASMVCTANSSMCDQSRMSSQGVNNAPLRREVVGLLLGFGRCDGKQLLGQLNRYGVQRANVEQAVAHANSVLAKEELD